LDGGRVATAEGQVTAGIAWLEALLVAAPGAWIAIGAFENIRVPKANGDMVAEVLSMSRMKAEEPEYYAVVSGNRIESPVFQRIAFGAIVVSESIAAVVMLAGALALAGAGLGFWGDAVPKSIAIVGTLAFTMVWSGLLVGGQWVHYWIIHQDAQHTHFMLALWGLATLALLLLV
jgi:predicted small integral membrane protein